MGAKLLPLCPVKDMGKCKVVTVRLRLLADISPHHRVREDTRVPHKALEGTSLRDRMATTGLISHSHLSS